MAPFLSIKLIVGIVVIAVLLNFVVYNIGADPSAEAVSGWRESIPETETLNSTGFGFTRGLLGSEATGNRVETLTSNRGAEPSDRTLSYEGVTYRLKGLVVNGKKSAATLIGDASDPVRVTVGGQLPGGQEVRAITLNEIVVINSEGREQSVRIYE